MAPNYTPDHKTEKKGHNLFFLSIVFVALVALVAIILSLLSSPTLKPDPSQIHERKLIFRAIPNGTTNYDAWQGTAFVLAEITNLDTVSRSALSRYYATTILCVAMPEETKGLKPGIQYTVRYKIIGYDILSSTTSRQVVPLNCLSFEEVK